MGLGHDLQEEAFYAGTCPGPLVGAESRWDAVRRWDRRWEGRDLGILGGWDRREETVTCRMGAWEETKGFSREDKGLGYSGGLGASKGL